MSGIRYIGLLSLLMLGLAAGCGADERGNGSISAQEQASREVPDFAACLARHLATHPAATAQDVYKFVHQSVAGPGHLIPNKQEALVYLEQEIADMGGSSEPEPLYEELGGELDLVRLNLRPYVEQGGDAEGLVDAMQKTAAAVTLDPEEMSRRLRFAADLLTRSGQDEERDALLRLVQEFANQGYPALHHSEAYSVVYRPAYRVISRAQANALVIAQ